MFIKIPGLILLLVYTKTNVDDIIDTIKNVSLKLSDKISLISFNMVFVLRTSFY